MALKKRKLGVDANVKRPKAQRKFAQGQYLPSTSYTYNCSSVNTTTPQVNNCNTEPPPEIFPNRPNTEDFLTFLCYRSTPSLPTNLDFVNKTNSEQNSTAKADSKKTTGMTPAASTSNKGRKKAANSTTKNSKNETTSATAVTTTITGADLKRKEDNTDFEETPPIKTKRKNPDINAETQNLIKGKFSKKKKSETLAASISSAVSALVPSSTASSPKTFKRNEKSQKSLNNTRRSLRTRNVEQMNFAELDDSKDLEIDDEKDEVEEPEDENGIIQNKKNPKNISKNEEKEGYLTTKTEPIKTEKQIGRPRKYPVSPIKEKASKKNESKRNQNTKSQSVQNEEDISEGKPETSTLSLSTPNKIQRNKRGPKRQKLLQANDVEEEIEDSIKENNTSETKDISDDVPLIKHRITKKESPLKLEPVEDEKVEHKSPKGRGRKSLTSNKKSELISESLEKQTISKENIFSNGGLTKNKFPNDVENESGVEDKKQKKTPGRKKKQKIETGFEEKKSKDFEKIEERHESGRPQRKTKEAAAIYMELIGHKLNSENYEEDESSESFPDLPNVKETAKLEQEMKANIHLKRIESEKSKSQPVMSPAAVPTPVVAIERVMVSKQGKKRLLKTKIVKAKKKQKHKMQSILTSTSLEKLSCDEKVKPLLVKKPLKRGRKRKLKNIKKHITGDTDKGSDAGQDDDAIMEDHNDELKINNQEILNNENQDQENEPNTFSESDDEPLAVKICKASESQPDTTPQQRSPMPRGPFVNPENSKSPKITNEIFEINPPVVPQTSNKPLFQTANTQSNQQQVTPAITTTPAPTPTLAASHFDENYLKKTLTSNHNFNQFKPTDILSPKIQQQSLDINDFAGKFPTFPPKANLVSGLPGLVGFQQSSPIAPSITPSSNRHHSPLEPYPSAAVNPTFLTPKFEGNSSADIGGRLQSNNTNMTGVVVNNSTTLETNNQRQISFSSNLKSGKNSPQAATNLFRTNILDDSTVPTSSSFGFNKNNTVPVTPTSSAFATNLMPSKEESGKIFGIASVSLAQSSGPDNTKCTLGKCGSIHKPTLGPVVPTESYLGEHLLSSKERRKAKVNMTHEQIHKWLIECSSNPDEILDDLDDDFDDLNKYNSVNNPSPTFSKYEKDITSFTNISGKKEKETTSGNNTPTKNDNIWSSKGPSVKAPPVVVTANEKDGQNKTITDATVDATVSQSPDNKNQNSTPVTGKKSPIKINHEDENADKIIEEIKKETPKNKTNVTQRQEKTYGRKNTAASTLKSKQKLEIHEKQEKITTEKEKSPPVKEKKILSETGRLAASKKNLTSTTSTTIPTTIPGTVASTSQAAFQTKKFSPIHSKLRQPNKDLDRLKVFSNSFTNSGENEKSVYTFDKEDDELPPIARTFRQPARRGSDNINANASVANTSNPTETRVEPEIPVVKETKPKRNIKKKETKVNNPKGNKKSNINLNVKKLKDTNNDEDDDNDNENGNEEDDHDDDSDKKLKTKRTSRTRRKSTMNEFILNDLEGETFYIPIQGATLTNSGDGSSKTDLVQAVQVKVKVGRDEANQRVSVQATLVTKPNLGRSSSPAIAASKLSSAINSSSAVISAGTSHGAPITASTSNENDDKKSSGKSTAGQNLASKSVPVGTVTPRFKSDGTIAANTSGLKRVNSASSLLSGSNKSRNNKKGGASTYQKKRKSTTPIKMYNNTAFPRRDDPAQMVEAPVFRPTDKEFHDPMEFIERITPIAARFGICKIIPPMSFKPECRVSDEMRFSAYNQYVHKMLYRWGPNVKELNAIKKHCQTQSVSLTPFPLIGQMQVDLPRLYHTVQEMGGLQEVMEKKKWNRVADEMCIPKLAQDRATRLDDIYCKYLLPYDTLSPAERQKLFDEVESDWVKCEARARRTADFLVNSENNSFEENFNEPSDDSEEEADGISMECIFRGKSMPLKQFVRIARNTSSLWFKNVEPTSVEVESEFWRHVAVRDSHVCVHSGSIDSSGWGYGFPSPGPKGKGSHCAKHPWNLKVLTNNPGSVLRSLGPVMGVTVPTLHVGMLFSACCWYRDPHGLSWIEYLHTGASKIWYGIPDDQSVNFRSALQTLIPSHCQNKTIWLPCDTVMVPPHMLTDRGVSLCRTEQKPGEFVVIFPRSYTSSISTGYVVSESVYFATATWLENARDDFKDIHDSCEPALFSLEQLLFSIASDQRVSKEVLEQCLPMLVEVFHKEKDARTQIEACGVTAVEKISQDIKGGKNKKKVINVEEDNECDICRANLYISVVKANDKNNTYCLEHALKYIRKGNLTSEQCTLLYTYSIDEINELIQKVRERLEQKKY